MGRQSKKKSHSRSRNSVGSRTSGASSRSGRSGHSGRSRSPRPSSGSRGSGGRGRTKSKKSRGRSHKTSKTDASSAYGNADFLTTGTGYTGSSPSMGGSTSGGGGGGGLPRKISKKPNFDKKITYVFFFLGVILALFGAIAAVLSDSSPSLGYIILGAGAMLGLIGLWIPFKLKDEDGNPVKAARLPRWLRPVNPKGLFVLSQLLLLMGFAFTFALTPDLGKAIGMFFVTLGITLLFLSCFLFRNREKQLLDAIGAKIEKKALANDQAKMKKAAKQSAYVDEVVEGRNAVSIYEEDSDDDVEFTYWRNTSIFATKADVREKRKLAAKRALKGATRTGEASSSDSYEDAFKEIYQPYFMWGMTMIHFWLYFTSLAINYDPNGNQPYIAPLKETDGKPGNFMIGSSVRTLVDMGGLLPILVKCYGEYSRLFTPIFLHTGLVHLGMNLLFQLRVGVVVERIYGPWRVGIIYLLAGFGGNLMSAVFKPSGRPVVGASSSLYGLLGVVLIDLIQNWYNLEEPMSALMSLLGMIAFSLGFGMLPYLDNFAHLGGMVTGMFSGVVFLPTITLGRKAREWKNGLVICSIPMLGLFLVGMMYAFISSSNNFCQACYQLDCPSFIPLCNDGSLALQQAQFVCSEITATYENSFEFLDCFPNSENLLIGPRIKDQPIIGCPT